jgi:hypothetical protein
MYSIIATIVYETMSADGDDGSAVRGAASAPARLHRERVEQARSRGPYTSSQ